MLITAAFSLFATLLFTEGLVRWMDPPPRAQVVRADGFSSDDSGPLLFELHGAPVWEQVGTSGRRDLDCPQDGTRNVVLLGSSILYGVSLEQPETVSARLPALLGDGWCVSNWAQPAFSSQGKLAFAKEAIPSLRPEVVIWEVWTGDAGEYIRLGDTAYELASVSIDDEGYPAVNWLPNAIHHTLFRRSRLWELGTLALKGRDNERYGKRWRDQVDEVLPELLSLTDQVGATLILAVFPSLDRPFIDSVNAYDEVQGYLPIYAWAKRQGVPLYEVAREMASESHEAVRLDPCCHYNARGHEALAPVLAGWIRASTEQQPGPGDDDDGDEHPSNE